ncbi:cilia- and flagella-associated protein 298 [Drosophila novamexicana]|uniref:cilia- and flagella-associated protein 298 n=1 Tax=Drosophila novamexicana TaxID=47314 RepID=UPI0011E5C212|nr:cilia- and flagella-associated protein 298 [Drosophila novamexicana]
MVMLHVKRGDENLFLYETSVTAATDAVIRELVSVFNGRLKIQRICMEIEELAEHGTMLPVEMIGLNDDQIEELKLKDTWADKCVPMGGFTFNKDPLCRRNGQQPNEAMRKVLANAMTDAKAMVDKKLCKASTALTLKVIEEALNILRGAVTIVYPMKLPPHDTIQMEFANMEDLSGTQASKEVIEPSKAQLWFAGRQILTGKLLKEYLGNNDKTKVVVKLNQLGEGPPAREQVITEQVRRQMMAAAYKRQEELKNFLAYIRISKNLVNVLSNQLETESPSLGLQPSF